MDNFTLLVVFGWVMTFFMIKSLPNAVYFTKTLLLQCQTNQAMMVMQQNLRQLSISVKLLLLVSNFIRPTDKNWAGDVDFMHKDAQLMRIPRWYDINPFSLKVHCQFGSHGANESLIKITPIISRKILIIDYLMVSTVAVILQFIQIFFVDDMSLGWIDMLQMMMIVLFPVMFYVEWRMSLFYLKKMYHQAGISAEFC